MKKYKLNAYLHLGFHKTASTNFQSILDNAIIQNEQIRIINMPEFRDYWKNGRWKKKIKSRERVETLFKTLRFENVLISDENIVGQTHHIFKSNRLYKPLKMELDPLKKLICEPKEVTILIFIRSMSTFLPSIYLEYLRWGSFKNFEDIFDGNYRQSWIPVITDIQEVFPNATIRIARYEDYRNVISKFIYPLKIEETKLKKIIGIKTRPSPPRSVVELQKIISYFVPNKFHGYFFRKLCSIQKEQKSNEKFSPFDDLEKKQLDEIYKNDCEIIKTLKNVKFVE